MKDLLKRWSELEPGVCQLSGFEIYTIAGRGICADFTYSHVGTYIYERELVLAWIQLAVQQAIEARDLNWAISFLVDESEPGYGGSQHTASVFTFGKRYVREGEISAAEAILSAYLKALEAGLKGDIL